jgi:hypothetical protein
MSAISHRITRSESVLVPSSSAMYPMGAASEPACRRTYWRDTALRLRSRCRAPQGEYASSQGGRPCSHDAPSRVAAARR